MNGYLVLLVFLLAYQSLDSCSSLNNQGPFEALKSRKYGIEYLYSKEIAGSHKLAKFRSVAPRKVLEEVRRGWKKFPPKRGASAVTPSPSPLPAQSVPEVAPPVSSLSPASVPSPVGNFGNSSRNENKKNRHKILIVVATVGGSVLLIASVVGIVFYKRDKAAAVRPWATGISGQLQKSFVTGVPKLRRLDLEAACEDFSNVIGSSSVYTLYKGTLSSGVEIAVASLAVSSAKDWSRYRETQFRHKIDTLSKINHKNFVNLIGYCEEDEPFTRMMVFEYAPNGTLFEHLHIKEDEHLDWATRMKLMMGVAYCLEHLHGSTPPLFLRSVNSSVIHLSDDYAAKMSDFVFWDETYTDGMDLDGASNNVYGFGVVLFEMMTGRLPYSDNTTPLEDWASDYLRGNGGGICIREMVDPTLDSFREDQMERIEEVIRLCVHPERGQRPSMREVSTRLREISGIRPDGATPKVSPLWWAELEIASA